MAHLISDIARALGTEVLGNANLEVTRAAEPQSALQDELALAMSPQYSEALMATNAKAALVWDGADWQGAGLEAAIVVQKPRLAMAHLTQALDTYAPTDGISDLADIANNVQIGAGCAIGAFCQIGAGVEIGINCQIGSHVSISEGATIGANTVLHPGVRIGRDVRIGASVVVQPNVVIGADGFSFVTEGSSNEERAFGTLGLTQLTPPDDAIRHKIHSLGSVVIDDDVEIGANSTVDAGTIRPTRIGRGAKIDNLVQVGHNVIVGEDCVLCAQTAVAGSSVIGDRSVLGGKSGVKDNVSIGADVVLGGAAIALSDVSDGQFMMGYPALPMREYRAQLKGLRALPGLLKKVRDR